jgi:hypothetical protein
MSLCVSSKNRRVTELNGSQDTVATAKSKSLLSETSLGLSLLRNRGLAAKDILLDLAGGCFRQLGHKLDSLGTLEVRQMITSVIAQLGFRRGRACF